jgi:hypothetical protein
MVVSRHSFGEILENEYLPLSSCKPADGALDPAIPHDMKGNGLDDWIDHVIVGWDEPMKTYFLQYIKARDEEDELVSWLGTDHAQIPTFDALCTAIVRSPGSPYCAGQKYPCNCLRDFAALKQINQGSQ